MAMSPVQKTSLGVREISGRPGQSLGSVVVPVNGKATMKIAEDILHTSVRTSFGLESKEVQTRIQIIDTVELVEGRLWWLLWFAIPAPFLLGTGAFLLIFLSLLIAFFFLYKQRWITIYSGNTVLVLFYGEKQRAREFTQTLLLLSRQLNGRAPSPNPSPKRAPQAPTGGVSSAQQ